MKKIILLLFFILLTSCASNLKEKPKQNFSLENQLNSLNYKLVLPEKWHPYLDLHGKIAYKPIKHSDRYPKVSISIRRIPPERRKHLTLRELVDENSNNVKYLKNYSSKKKLIQTKFGETYVLDQAFNLNSKSSIIRSTYFEYKGNYYCYIFYSKAISFNRYIDDYGLIFEQFEFRD
ncbi:hypothetical protein HZY62_13045 [Maribacter polysiphoniae]|uniref:Lipoprotein n=1 Tax=Maribacter polysiphoniae TaxID=429344 RepID=A0A316DWV7_9FLAO|nr:hypothetical protein [Maribacter polysiphoniae]MBD1261524.1 hypothetical protein [Maribacter polysiphoniae]PWK22857.1 hypothetical protein LX92_02795 [Maribacter polysiphoniae]